MGDDTSENLPPGWLYNEEETELFERVWAGTWKGSNSRSFVPPMDDVKDLFEKPMAFLLKIGFVKRLLGEECGVSGGHGRRCSGQLKYDAKNYRFYCSKKGNGSCEGHRVHRPVFKGTMLEGAHLTPKDFLFFCYFWLCELKSKQIGIITGVTPQIVANWTGHIEQAVAFYQDTHHEPIGGPEVIVTVDETKMGKRKYDRGHWVGDNSWVLVAVERLYDYRAKAGATYFTGRVVAYPVMNRKAETCKEFIEYAVAPGSQINTDEWFVQVHSVSQFFLN